jgi:hypothetical protein
MYSDILRRIAGIEVFPVISLLTFVAVFTAVLVWTVRLDLARVIRISRLPLDDTDPVPVPSTRDARLPRRDA